MAQLAILVLHSWANIEAHFEQVFVGLMEGDEAIATAIYQELRNASGKRAAIKGVGKSLIKYEDDRKIYNRFKDIITSAAEPRNEIEHSSAIHFDRQYLIEFSMFYDSLHSLILDFEDYMKADGDLHLIGGHQKRKRYVSLIGPLELENIWYVHPSQEGFYQELSSQGVREPDGRIWSRKGASGFFRG